jgi:exonuclease SbcC
MKIAGLADLHCCREHAEEALVSLWFFTKYIEKSPVDLVTISGDVWDASMLNTEASGFTRFVEAIRDIADKAPVCLVYGTPSHDTDGSLEIFRNLNSIYGITILEPEQEYFLHRRIIREDVSITFISEENLEGTAEAIIFGIPEPRRKYLLANTAAGKYESEEALRGAMRRLCFALAAKRREYADIPCVTLYHGEVAGASLQNDETIERGTGISITIDDLNDIDADYYALGHIHKPQRVGNLPAYYAGSIYPKNFGENHKAGFNMVELTKAGSYGWNAEVKRVDFPHPQNLKISTTDPMTYEIPDGGIAGRRVWLEIICTKEQKALINAVDELAQLRKLGAVEGSRVTISDIPVETVRAAEITAVKTAAEKFRVWAENSGVKAAESVIRKINRLRSDISVSTPMKASGEWELVSVRLRGAVGIGLGIGRDEICLNFDDYLPGLIAVSGANGKGKTTLIENCHPYPQLLTRRGKLQDHFSLRDSFREVILREPFTGMKAKFLIQIDGVNKSGACKYFAFRMPEGKTEWEPLEGIDGNLKPYADLLERTFGPLDLYLHTAFITQRPTKNLPDLTDATAGEKKTLFVALAGIDYLQQYADMAADKAKAETAAARDAETKAQTLQAVVAGKETAERELREAEAALETDRRTLEEVTAKGQAAKADVDRLQKLCEAEWQRQHEETTANAAIANAAHTIGERERDIARYREAAENRELFENRIATGEALQETIGAENEKKRLTMEENAKKTARFIQKKAEFDAKVKKLEKEQDSLRNRRNELEKNAALSRNNIKLYERDAAEIKEDCPTCGQRLPTDKLAELKNRRLEFLAKIEAETAALAKFNEELESLSARLEDLTDNIAGLSFDAPEPEKDTPFDDRPLLKAEAELRQINLPEARAALAEARDAAARIEGLEREIETQRRIITEQKAALAALTARIEPDYGVKTAAALDAAKNLHAELSDHYTETKAAIARNEAVSGAAKARLAAIAEHEKELAAARSAAKLAKAETAEWELVSKAFGKDGIQALELDALAPGISDTANRILDKAFNGRFRVEIQTTRIGGAGKKVKQIEDFLIFVTDTEKDAGQPALLEEKSGGEAVWIKRAIYDAFSVVRRRNTGFAFLTCFQDEADGALDSAAKTAYARMLAAAHEENRLRHTVIITHSNEVKAMIDQKIDMDDFAREGAA